MPLAEKDSGVNTVLDRDGAKFGLNPEETQKHRSLMWEIYTYDSWMVRLSRVLRRWLAEVLTELDVRATEFFPPIIDRLRDGP